MSTLIKINTGIPRHSLLRLTSGHKFTKIVSTMRNGPAILRRVLLMISVALKQHGLLNLKTNTVIVGKI